MVVDLAPYRILLDRLKSEISALRRARNQVAENYVHQEGYIKLLYSLEQESRVEQYEYFIAFFLKEKFFAKSM